MPECSTACEDSCVACVGAECDDMARYAAVQEEGCCAGDGCAVTADFVDDAPCLCR